MKYDIIEIENLIGPRARMYSIFIHPTDETKNSKPHKTVFDRFMEDHINTHFNELKEIAARLKTISQVGALEEFFKMNEGIPGDGMCALYDKKKSKLRLYCIRYNKFAVILGGGGPKSKKTKAWQDDPKLRDEAELMIKISHDISQRLTSRELTWCYTTDRLLGDLLNLEI